MSFKFKYVYVYMYKGQWDVILFPVKLVVFNRSIVTKTKTQVQRQGQGVLLRL